MVIALVQIFADRMPQEIITIAALQLLIILALRRSSFIKIIIKMILLSIRTHFISS
jgi:hypothetical protein